MCNFLLISIFIVFSSSLIAEELALELDNQLYQSDRVNQLKDKVLNEKTQLSLLKLILEEESLDTQYPELLINFRNEMTDRYRIHSIVYYIDNVRAYSFLADDELDEKASRKAASINKPSKFKVSLAPGKHNLKVVVFYTGNDSGVFSYLSDYKVRSETELNLNIKRGSAQKLKVVSFEKGGMLTDFKERPSVRIIKLASNKRLKK